VVPGRTVEQSDLMRLLHEDAYPEHEQGDAENDHFSTDVELGDQGGGGASVAGGCEGNAKGDQCGN
jgi:hypothetical protein